MPTHTQLPDAGIISHHDIDAQLPTIEEKAKLQTLAANVPVEVTGARNDPEGALANLITALATLGLLADSTTAT